MKARTNVDIRSLEFILKDVNLESESGAAGAIRGEFIDSTTSIGDVNSNLNTKKISPRFERCTGSCCIFADFRKSQTSSGNATTLRNEYSLSSDTVSNCN
jgi:hypothetical protein